MSEQKEHRIFSIQAFTDQMAKFDEEAKLVSDMLLPVAWAYFCEFNMRGVPCRVERPQIAGGTLTMRVFHKMGDSGSREEPEGTFVSLPAEVLDPGFDMAELADKAVTTPHA